MTADQIMTKWNAQQQGGNIDAEFRNLQNQEEALHQAPRLPELTSDQKDAIDKALKLPLEDRSAVTKFWPSEMKEALRIAVASAPQSEVAPPPQIASSYFERYVEKECKTDEEKESLKSDVCSFWDRLREYQKPETGNRAYGLAVGRVQSGKTRNYIGLMFKAIDEGYNTIIVLTSKSKRLAVQTHKRVERWFGGRDPQNPSFTGLEIPNLSPLTQIYTRSEGREAGVEWRGANFSSNRIHVGVVIKNESGHLEEVKNWIDNLPEASRTEIKLLFIDDESDSATPNTNNICEPSIGNESDVARLVHTVRDYVYEGTNDIVEWIRLVCDKNTVFDSGAIGGITGILRKAVTKQSMMNAILQNQDLINGAQLDREISIGGQQVRLNRLVYNAFGKKATKRQPLNWTVLRDLLNYAFGVRQERSRINRSICELVGDSATEPRKFDYGELAYVGYTATPFANLLNENPQSDPLCPDCIKPLTTSSRYFGLQRIFGSEGVECNMNVVRTIDPDESTGWVEALQNGDFPRPVDPEDEDKGWEAVFGNSVAETLTRNHNFAEDKEPEDIRSVEWKSLKRAVMWAFCTAAARRIYRKARGGEWSVDDGNSIRIETKYRWTTMLFNVSHLSSQENGVHPVQQQLLEKYLAWQTNEQNRDDFINACCQVWEEETAKFTVKDFERACPGYGNVASYPDAERVANEIRNWFIGRRGKYQVIQMNSNCEDLNQLDYNNPECQDGDVLWFVCGGNAISRGLTLEGLTVSYYDRIKRSTSVDSITQMGRWFGYRPGYELLPRIWMTEETVSEMKNICRIEEQLHNDLEDLFADEDHTSIREGRNVADIRYFGRRLSGRDANGIEIPDIKAKAIFDTVANDPSDAFRITKDFIFGLPDGNKWRRPAGINLYDFQTRHENCFWMDVDSDYIRTYIDKMAKSCFRRAAQDSAQGLMRAMKVNNCKWNIVIGCPSVADFAGRELPHLTGLLGFENVTLRNNTLSPLGDATKIGHNAATTYAFLTAIPPERIRLRLGEDSRRITRNCNFDSINNVFSSLQVDDQNNGALNPTLLIDFVNNPESLNNPYVQVSFFWYGLESGRFYRAITNPIQADNLIRAIEKAIEKIEENRYISFKEIERYLGIEHRSEEGVLLRRQLLEEAERRENRRIGIINNDNCYCLCGNIFYANSWFVSKVGEYENDPPILLEPARFVGLDFYRRVIDNRWVDEGCSKLDTSALDDNYLKWIINFNMWDPLRDRCEREIRAREQHIEQNNNHKVGAIAPETSLCRIGWGPEPTRLVKRVLSENNIKNVKDLLDFIDNGRLQDVSNIREGTIQEWQNFARELREMLQTGGAQA